MDARPPSQGGEEAAAGGGSTRSGTSPTRTAETLLRLLPLGLCMVALVLMLKNSQTNDYGSLSYSHLGAFRYLVNANGVCAGYSLLSAVAVVAAAPPPLTMFAAWSFFLLDQVLTYVILAAAATSAEVVYLAYKGDQGITWSEACGSFGGFCRRATASTAITFLVLLCYALLSLISSYRLFTNFDPPVITPKAKGTLELGNGSFHG